MKLFKHLLLSFIIFSGFQSPALHQAGAVLEHLTRGIFDQINGSLQLIHDLVDSQREAINQDVLEVISEVTVSVEHLLAEAEAALGAFQDELDSDVRYWLSTVQMTLDNLVDQVQKGTSEAIREAANEADRVVEEATVSFRALIESIRPQLAKADLVGENVIIRTESAVSATLIRIAGMAALIVGVCGFCILALFVRRDVGETEESEDGVEVAEKEKMKRDAEKKHPMSRLVIFPVLVLSFITGGGFWLLFRANHISDRFEDSREVKDYRQDCIQMFQDGPDLLNATQSDEPVDPEFALQMREVSARCGLFTDSAVEANTAETYLTAALRALNAPVL